MMALTFGPADIARWARFSGDYNPIHFDQARARQLGAEGVIAHGMLVLLGIKSLLSAPLLPGGGWWLFRARLRHPVLAEETVRLDTRVQGEGVAFSLLPVPGARPPGRKLLTGSISRLAAVPDTVASGSRYRLEPGVLGARLDELNEAFPWPGEFWVAADAIVFAEFLHRGIRDVLAPHGIDLGRDAEPSDPGRVVVQTTHEVAFDRDILGGAGPEAADLDIEVVPPQIDSVEDGVSATCQLVTRSRGRVVMVTTLGLFIRQLVASGDPHRPG
jgi:hypothetical protein